MKSLISLLFLMMVIVGFAQDDNAYINEIDIMLETFPKEKIEESDKTSIVQIYQKEKLTRDIYSYLFNEYGYSVFEKISQSEQLHMNLLGLLIKRYNIKLKFNDEPGVFMFDSDKEVYDKYTGMVKGSFVKALEVGLMIEERDILEISKVISSLKLKDFQFIFINLSRSSRNHLRLFYSQYRFNGGGQYKSQWLGDEEFKKLISLPLESQRIIYEP